MTRPCVYHVRGRLITMVLTQHQTGLIDAGYSETRKALVILNNNYSDLIQMLILRTRDILDPDRDSN